MSRCLVPLLACLLAGWPVGGQEAGSEPPSIELSFSRVSGRAGEAIRVPVYLKSEATAIEPFRIGLRFRPSLLDYRGFETAYLAQYAGWGMNARLQEREPDDETAVLEIAVDPGQKEFFPSGVVAYVQFGIQENVPDGEISIEAGLHLSPSASLTARAEPAVVAVYTQAIMACFFYMH